MILDPRLLSIIVLSFHKVATKPLPQDADAENFGQYDNTDDWVVPYRYKASPATLPPLKFLAQIMNSWIQ